VKSRLAVIGEFGEVKTKEKRSNMFEARGNSVRFNMFEARNANGVYRN
jgi:hypothetical protein